MLIYTPDEYGSMRTVGTEQSKALALYLGTVSDDARYLSGFYDVSCHIYDCRKAQRSQSLAIIQTTKLPILKL